MIDKYWNEMLQVLTEDENLRIRKGDMMELERTEIREFCHHLKLFEDRIEQRVAQLEKLKSKQRG